MCLETHREVLQLLLCQPVLFETLAAARIPAEHAAVVTTDPFLDEERALVAGFALVRDCRKGHGEWSDAQTYCEYQPTHCVR